MAAISCCKTDYQELNCTTRASIKNVLGTELLTKDETIRPPKENVSVCVCFFNCDINACDDNKKFLVLIQGVPGNMTVGE